MTEHPLGTAERQQEDFTRKAWEEYIKPAIEKAAESDEFPPWSLIGAQVTGIIHLLNAAADKDGFDCWTQALGHISRYGSARWGDRFQNEPERMQ